MTPEAATAPHPPRRLEPPTPRVALVIAAAVVVGVFLYLGRHALTPFIIGALLVYILDPAVGFLSRVRIGKRTIPRGLAVLLVYIATFFIVVEAFALLLGPLISQAVEYLRDLPRLIASLDAILAQLASFYRSLELPPQIRDFIDSALEDLGSGAGQIDFGSLLPIARTLLGTAAGFFGFLIIPIWAFYILRDRVRLTERLATSLPPSWRDDVWSVLTIIERVFGRWIRAQLLLGVIVGAVTWLGLMLLGWLVDPRFQDFAVLLAVIAGILELLPIIGPILSMIPTLLVALTTQDPVVGIVAVVILYTAIQQVEGAVLVPWIQGDAVQLHPSVVIFVLIVGGSIAGLLGAILAIPITAAGMAVYRYLFHRLSDDLPPGEAMPVGGEARPPNTDVGADRPPTAPDGAEDATDQDAQRSRSLGEAARTPAHGES
jgi:predicted PurR-regulated permease PerM